MKKRIAVIAILALTLAGCSSGNAAPADADTASSNGKAAAAQPAVQGQPGDKPEAVQGKRVRGQIQDMLGNEVTLALMEEPERPEGATADVPKPAATGGDPMGLPRGNGQSREVKLTGETLGIRIPVGVPIISRGQGGESALQLSDLTAGNILTVLYDTDGVTIIQVTVSSGSAQ